MLCWPSHLTNEMTYGTNDWKVPRILSLWSHPPRLSRVGHPCPGGVTGSSSEALWALPTYQWHWPWHTAALQHMKLGCLKFKTSMAWNLIHLQCRSKISSEDSFSHVFKQLRETAYTFHVYGMFIMSVLSPTLGTRPQSFGGTNMENQFRGRTTSCCFRLASASSRSILVTHQSHQKYANRKFLQLISSVVVDPTGRPPQTAGASTDSHPQP